jgi:PEP-CTERM motif
MLYRFRLALPAAALTATLLVAAGTAPAFAGAVFSTDRLGYTGSVQRYDTLADAQAGTNALDSVAIGNRDASIEIVDGMGADSNTVMGSWWYTTSSNGAGWGNTHGNTGIGFTQLYDSNGSTDTSVSMGFGGFDGTNWTTYHVSLTGADATSAEDATRVSAYDNVHDGATFLSYSLDVTVTGLQGNQTGNMILANNHPTGVTGSYTVLYTYGGDPDGYPDGVGPDGWADDFYVMTVFFDMDNWAFSQNGALDGPYQNDGRIYSSLFIQQIPEPGTLGLMGLGLAGLGAVVRRRRKAAAAQA